MLKTLTQISLKSKNANERAEANGLKNFKISSYISSGNFSKNVFFHKFSRFAHMQSKSINMKDAGTHLKSVYESVKQMRENFVENYICGTTKNIGSRANK